MIFISVLVKNFMCGDLADGIRPPDYRSTKWVCQNYPMYFYVPPGDAPETGVNKIGNEEKSFGFFWTLMTSGVSIHTPDYQGERIASGECFFSERLFIIRIYDAVDGYFEEGQLLIFWRYDMPAKSDE